VATPMDTGLRFAGTVELAGLAAPPDWRRARILLKQGRKMLPGLAASHAEERISVWMGHRPSLPDSLPVLGPSRASPDVVYAFGHGHIGMNAAAMTGKIVADLVAGRPASIDIVPFAPGRFGALPIGTIRPHPADHATSRKARPLIGRRQFHFGAAGVAVAGRGH